MGSIENESYAVPSVLQEGISYWAKRWEEKKTGFHMNEVNPNLSGNIEALTNFHGSKEGKDAGSRKILVPLCGQTEDLLYLLSLGHEVFGIEAVYECIVALAERDGFKFIFDEESSIYHTEDRRLQIYFGDIFKCPIEKWGPFDCIWDRGSLIAIEYPERQIYAELMKRSGTAANKEINKSAHDFRYLLEAVSYDRAGFAGPPRSITKEDLSELFPWAHVEILSNKPLPENGGLRKVVPDDFEVFEIVYMISPN